MQNFTRILKRRELRHFIALYHRAVFYLRPTGMCSAPPSFVGASGAVARKMARVPSTAIWQKKESHILSARTFPSSFDNSGLIQLKKNHNTLFHSGFCYTLFA